jgi:hypothetical protein
VALDSRRPLPVAPRPFIQEALGGWIGRVASRYRMSVREFAEQMELDLEGHEGGAGWLLLPAQSTRTLGRLAVLARLDPEVLRAIEIPKDWIQLRKRYSYCPRCVFLNPDDVASPYWKRHWLDPAAALCEAHATPLRAIPASRVRTCQNLGQLLTLGSRYERERQRAHDPLLR